MKARANRRAVSPAEIFGGLFERVAMAGICDDGKAWADAEPRRGPAAILREYQARPPRTDDDLRAFVIDNFAIGLASSPLTQTDGVGPLAAIQSLWPALTRLARTVPPHSSLLALPHAYLAPGGRFNETYYWDAYFTLLGRGDRQAARETADNFAHLIRGRGFVPNGNRTYYLSRSQPPLFFLIAGLTEPEDPAAAYARYLPELIAEHRWWMRGAARARLGAPVRRVVRLAGGGLLNRYWDDKDTPRDESYRQDVLLADGAPQSEADLWRNLRAGAESGWDFSSRWMADRGNLHSIRTSDIVPIDLNAILFGLEGAIADGLSRQGDQPAAARYRRRAAARRRAIVRHLWNQTAGLFDDLDWRAGRQRDAVTAAAVYPLFFGLADPAQAARTAEVVRRDLLAAGGLLTTTLTSGQQWDAPNGWAPLQWLAVRGFERYGHDPLAAEIAGRWCRMVFDIYERTGRFFEKYDVISRRPGGGGEYAIQDGFGWTNGVTARLAAAISATPSKASIDP